MERASKLLGAVQFPTDSVSVEALVCAAWPVTVGKKIAAHTRAARLVRSNLVVEVDDEIWKRQLFGMRGQIVASLKEFIGSAFVDGIEFRVVPRRRSPHRAGEILGAAAPLDGDEATRIADPVMRRVYRMARKRAQG